MDGGEKGMAFFLVLSAKRRICFFPKSIKKSSEDFNLASDVIRAGEEQEWTPLGAISVAR